MGLHLLFGIFFKWKAQYLALSYWSYNPVKENHVSEHPSPPPAAELWTSTLRNFTHKGKVMVTPGDCPSAPTIRGHGGESIVLNT